MTTVLASGFLDNEIKLAQYYTNLRDRIGALNVAFSGFILAIYETASENEFVFFFLLLLLGFASFVSCLRAGIAYRYHFNNYECFIKENPEILRIIEGNRIRYSSKKNFTAWFTFGSTKVSTLFYWAILIGSLCPIVALAAFSPFW